MAVMAREDAWTDERLDDLKAQVEGIDRRIENGFAEMRAEFKEVRAEFKEVRAESISVRRDTAGQFAAQNRMMIQLFGGMFATVVVGFLGVIVAIVTQT